jgi:uncharacterized protein
MVDQPIVVVRGEALREVAPEQALLSVTVSAVDADRQAAVARLTERSADLKAVLDDYPEAVERRETAGVQIHPYLKRGSDRVATYTASVTTTVTMTDFAAMGELLLRLGAQDDTSVSGPWWRLRPGSRAGADVRKEAIADALQRARDYAEAVGARVDRLLEIQDEGAGGMHPMARSLGVELASADSLEIDPQLQTVQAAVILRVGITEPVLID